MYPSPQIAIAKTRTRRRAGGQLPIWTPYEDSPQERAYSSEATVIGYGGAAGGGKTQFALGYGLNNAHRGVIHRLNNGDLQDIIQEGDDLLAGVTSFVRGEKRRWDLPGGRMLMATSLERMSDVRKVRGRGRDYIAFDEATEFQEMVIRTTMGWLRTVKEDVQPKVILTFNPPTDAGGEWLIQYFGAWIDPDHPNPAADGELRWYIRKDDKDVEVPDGTPVLIDGIEYKPQSRTFFHARVEDNPALMATGYRDQLNTLPEPLRSQLLYGDMSIGTQDDAWQVIPTAWILAAEERYRNGKRPDLALRAVGVDPSRGGDEFGIAKLYGDWFEVIGIEGSGSEIDGQQGAALVEREILNDGPAPMYIDSIGIGASVYDVLKMTNNVTPMNAGASAGSQRDKSGKYHFANQRAMWWWMFRQALDPQSEYAIALPPIRKLRQDLRSPRYKLRAGKVVVESKEDVKKRTGRSTDYGDPVIQAWYGVSKPKRKFLILD